MFRSACRPTHVLIIVSILLLPSVISHHEGAECGCMFFRGVCKMMRQCPELTTGMPFQGPLITCGQTFNGQPIVCCPKHWTHMEGNMRPHFKMNPMIPMIPVFNMNPINPFNMNPFFHMNSKNPPFNVNPPFNTNPTVNMNPTPNNSANSPQIGSEPTSNQPSKSPVGKDMINERVDSSPEIINTENKETDPSKERRDSKPISATKCQEYNNIVRGTDQKCPDVKIFVIGGVEAASKEAPFMALIGYGNKNSLEWKCGGSLISPRFVLSAAHCNTSPSGPPRVARLGDLDISRTDDDAQPVDHDIEEFINHPDYNPAEVYNDIALLRLKTNVKFNDYIKPICLPEPGKVGWITDVIAAGWGRTDFVGRASPKLLKVDLEGLDISDCNGTAENNPAVPRGLDDNTMVCAGKLDGDKDTCSGDSGGPLFLPPRLGQSPDCELRTQVGITSFGKQCGLQGYPGVYTKVEAYVFWIESHVWPANKFDTRKLFIWTDK